MKFEDMAEFELNIQKDRLKYIKTTLNKEIYCNFPPRKIYIEPTNVCNYKCIHCVHNGALSRKPSYLDVSLYKRRIDEIEHLRLHTKIQFTGVGEPLLHKNIFEIINYAAQKGFFTLMNTNASLLTRENSAKLVDSGLDYLHISIDGARAETYEKIRKGGKFRRVIENLFNLFEARYEKKGYHLAVILGIIEQEKNRKELEEFQKFFSRFPFHHIVTGTLFNHMGTIEEANLAYRELNSQPPAEYPCCNTPWDLLSINSDGSAVGCNYDFDNRYVIGDLARQGFMEIWNDDRMLRFRKAILDHHYTEIEKNGSLCSRCTIKWQQDYRLPENFYSEIARMEDYLVRAVRRCSGHRSRNISIRNKEQSLFKVKQTILNEVS